MTRRELLLLGTGLIAGCDKRSPRRITGSFAGASHDIGHLLRGGSIPAPSRERRVRVVIVGGGIAGLSAGWKLAREGFHDFEILELESEAGGNSRSGENSVSAYPWGAHYVPLPTKDSQYVRELFEELGVITGYDPQGEPVYNDRYLCFDPHERLFIHGRWQEGLIPALGTTSRDRDDLERFEDIIDSYRSRHAFTIPMELSLPDAALDSISIRDFLINRGLQSPALLWYVNYACRDDYGTDYSEVSAWAGIHYFASRGKGDGTVLTWPEGNGWIVKRLREKLQDHIKTASLVFAISRDGVDVFDTRAGVSTRLRGDHVVFACPTYLAKYLIKDAPSVEGLEYAPWLVANLTLDSLPQQRAGAPIAWDNVIYDSESLGYVVATHQSLATHQARTVLTYYYPLAGSAGSSPGQERSRLLNTAWETWVDVILADLSKPHPEIRDIVQNIDIMRWGHAMVRPRPGFIWGEARKRLTQPLGNIHFAHSDLSGFSLFEEAQYRGVIAAERIMSSRV